MRDNLTLLVLRLTIRDIGCVELVSFYLVDNKRARRGFVMLEELIFLQIESKGVCGVRMNICDMHMCEIF